MNYQKQYFPDDPPTDTPTAPASTPAIPQAEMDLLTVCESVRDKWTATPAITLLWKTPAQFAADVAAYRTHLTGARALGASRPAQTSLLDDLDNQINEAVGAVKVYIQKKWKDAAKANYYRFGIVKENKTYQLPKDRDDRKEAFDLMINAVDADGFGEEEYGTDYWVTMKAQYTATLDAANSTDGQRSDKVASKNQAKREVKKVLKSLLRVLEGNYPDSHAQVIREWGWQREDY